jgi:hypothetical protein
VLPAAAGKLVLVLHALAAAVLLGACTHQAIVAVQLLRGRVQLQRLARVYSAVIPWAFAAAFVAGLVMYPAFRYRVRALYLDRWEPWASNLFDFKESLAALALPLAVGLFAMGRRLDVQEERSVLPLFAFFAVGLWALVAFTFISGLIVTSVRGV